MIGFGKGEMQLTRAIHRLRSWLALADYEAAKAAAIPRGIMWQDDLDNLAARGDAACAYLRSR